MRKTVLSRNKFELGFCKTEVVRNVFLLSGTRSGSFKRQKHNSEFSNSWMSINVFDEERQLVDPAWITAVRNGAVFL
jgi:hypothetical protein